MTFKSLITSLFLMMFIFSCSTLNSDKSTSSGNSDSKKDDIDQLGDPMKIEVRNSDAPFVNTDAYPSINSDDLDKSRVVKKANKIIPIRVIVDELGINFLMALGVLKELEKKGFKIVTLYGIGSSEIIEFYFARGKKISYVEWNFFKLLNKDFPLEDEENKKHVLGKTAREASKAGFKSKNNLHLVDSRHPCSQVNLSAQFEKEHFHKSDDQKEQTLTLCITNKSNTVLTSSDRLQYLVLKSSKEELTVSLVEFIQKGQAQAGVVSFE